MGRRGNPYFHFQQFSIEQDRCAMKVGVDGILLGAWATVESARQILDIGTGTGLISLMLAQRATTANIIALEIDIQASRQAHENCLKSPWEERIQIIPIAFQEFLKGRPPKFELIVSNPPFFENNQLIGARQLAREQKQLSPIEILKHSAKLLTAEGRVALILPRTLERTIEQSGKNVGLHLQRKTYVKPTPSKAIKRILLEFTQKPSELQCNELVIEQSRHHYSPEYKTLTQDFLLNNSPQNRTKIT